MPTPTRTPAAEFRARFQTALRLPSPQERAPQLRAVLEELNDAKKSAWADMDGIMKPANAAERALLASEQRQYDDLARELDEYTATYDDLLRQAAIPDRSDLIIPGQRQGGDDEYRAGAPLTRDQTVTGYVAHRGLSSGDHEGLRLGPMLRGMVTGQWGGADGERRAMSEGVLSAGGITVPAPLAAKVIDRVRNTAQVLRAGAQVVPMESETLKVPRVTGDPTASWHSENALIPESDMTFDGVDLKAKMLTSRVLASWELLDDSPVALAALERAFVDQMALGFDFAALYGTGTGPEPRGVKNQAGVTATALGANGASPTWDHFLGALERLATRNHTANGIIHAPRTEFSLARLKDADGNYHAPPAMLAGLSRYPTNQVPTNLTQGTATNASDSFVADWGEMYWGVRSTLIIRRLEERYADTGQVGFVVAMRGDIQLARPAAFEVLTGVTP